MKRIRVVVIGIICISLVVGYYYYLSNKNTTSDETELTEVEKVVLKDLEGDSYPTTPREVIKLYNRILCCYYNEEYTEEEFQQLTGQALALMDEELLENNPPEQYRIRVQAEVDNYHYNEKKINNASVCDSNDIKYADIDGSECAYVTASYFMRDANGFTKSNQNYILRKDTEDKWRILAFELDKGVGSDND